jgi:hypothetical protein
MQTVYGERLPIFTLGEQGLVRTQPTQALMDTIRVSYQCASGNLLGAEPIAVVIPDGTAIASPPQHVIELKGDPQVLCIKSGARVAVLSGGHAQTIEVAPSGAWRINSAHSGPDLAKPGTPGEYQTNRIHQWLWNNPSSPACLALARVLSGTPTSLADRKAHPYTVQDVRRCVDMLDFAGYDLTDEAHAAPARRISLHWCRLVHRWAELRIALAPWSGQDVPAEVIRMLNNVLEGRPMHAEPLVA